MTIAEQAKVVVSHLKGWTDGNKGRVFVAADVMDLIERVRQKPGAPTAAVLWVNEEPRTEVDILGRVDRLFKVVVSRGRSLKLQPGESLTDGAAGAEPMFDQVEQAREICLGIRLGDSALNDEDQVPTYKGSGPFEVNGMVLDCVEIRFTLPAQITVQMPDGGIDN